MGQVARAFHSEAVVSVVTLVRGLRGVGPTVIPTTIFASTEAVLSGIVGQKPALFGDTEVQAVLLIIEEVLGCVRHFGSKASACFGISQRHGHGPLVRATVATGHRHLPGSSEPGLRLVVESSERRVVPGSIADVASRLCQKRLG